MGNDFLSQEEIDALLNKNNKTEEEKEIETEIKIETESESEIKTEAKDELVEDFSDELDSIQKDIIGEVGNISMSTAATTLSSILNHRVLITTPRVSVVPFKQVIEECSVPKVVANIEFKEGLEGDNFLMVDISDAAIIADLMMGGDGSGANEKLTELELSAVAEAMNQMIGSASTSMATMLNRTIDIFPPDVSLWENEDSVNHPIKDTGGNICKIAFDLTVEGLIQSEIMQIYTMETVKEISSIMMKGEKEDEQTEQSTLEPTQEEFESQLELELESEEPIKNQTKSRVVVQKPVFQDLNPEGENTKAPRNLDLIMDVPLEFSVVLGKSKKTIQEVLSFNNGSVIELNKLADEPLEIYVNSKLIAEGEVVIINENFGVRITNILSKEQRVKNLK